VINRTGLDVRMFDASKTMGNDLPTRMRRKYNTVPFAWFVRLMAPLVRILLHHGIAYGTFSGLLRKVYVDVAFAEFAPEGRKQTASRISALTRLTRKEVKRLLELGAPDDTARQERFNRGVRVISGWVNDRRFPDARRPGRP
jgi:hypothetical protein